MYEQLALYIDGEFLTGDGRRTQDVVNPATLEVLGQLPHASEADLDRALAAAQRAFETWKRTSPMERAAILRKVGQLSRDRAQEIGRNMTLDQGKPLAEAVGEVASCSEHADWHAEECRRIYGRVIPAAQSGCPPVRGARAHRRMRRVHALELPVQPGHPQDRRRAGRRLHGGAQGAGRFPQRRNGDRPHVPRSRPAQGLPEHRLGRTGQDLRLPDPLAHRAQGVVHGFRACRQATGRPGRRAHEARHHGARRPFAGAGVRRCRRRPGRRNAGALQGPQRRPGMRVAHPLLCAERRLRAVPGPLYRGAQEHQGRRRPGEKAPTWVRWRTNAAFPP